MTVEIKTRGRDPFGTVQLVWYILSSLGMVLYFLHFMTFHEDIKQRTNLHAFMEVFILVGRSVNEYNHGRYDVGDILHHLALFFTVLFTTYQTHCKPHAWLTCHMNILHFPMALWYLGCKRGCYSSDTTYYTQTLCTNAFPKTWFLAMSYRFTIMYISAIMSYQESKYILSILIFLLALLMTYLDYNWMLYFLDTLRYDIRKRVPVSISYCMVGFMAGILTVYYL